MLLQVENLHVSYGAIRALHGVSLRVERGEIVCIVGANGAGKTTLLRTVSGLLRPTGGAVVWRPEEGATKQGRRELHKLKPHEIVRLGVSQSPEGRQVFPSLSVADNLNLGAYQQRDRAKVSADLDHVYGLFPVLAERRKQKAGTLSGGEQQMLAVGRALMQRPTLLLLDEPSLGLAPLIVKQIFEIIRAVNAEGTTVLLVEQNANQALRLAHRAYVLQTGEMIKSGPAAELLEDPDVKKAYLGG